MPTKSRTKTNTLLLLAISIAPSSLGQPAPPATDAIRPQFEVASIKIVNRPLAPNSVRLITRHGTLTTVAASLKQLVGLAYSMQPARVYGGPDWVDHERYDILTKAENPHATTDEIRAITQSLLADRFKLAFHRETKQLLIFTVTVAKNGPKLREANPDEQFDATGNRTLARIQFAYRRASVVSVVNLLTDVLGSPVQDKTGLTGLYDFELEYARDSIRPSGDAGPPVPNDAPVDSGPSLYAALQEQLGLKLEERKGLVEVIVIDHVDHPSEN